MAGKDLKVFLEIITGGFGRLNQDVKVAAANLKALGDAAKRADQTLAGMQRAAAGGLAGLTAVATLATKEGLNAFAVYENLGGALDNLVRSHQIGTELMNKAVQLSVVTPFEPNDVVSMTTAVLGYNESLLQLIRTGDKMAQQQLFERVRQYGDIATGAAINGVQPLEVVNALEKLRTTGMWETEQYARIGLYKSSLAPMLGLDSQGNLMGTATQKWEAAMEVLLDKYEDGMAKASRRLTGIVSTVRGNVKLAWTELGKGMSDDAKGVMDRFNSLLSRMIGEDSPLKTAGKDLAGAMRPYFETALDFLENLISRLNENPQELANALRQIISLIQGLAAALGAIIGMRLILQLVSGLGQLSTLLAGGPLGIIGAAAVSIGLIALFNKFTDAMNEAAATSGTYGAAISQATAKTAELAQKKEQLQAKIKETQGRIDELKDKVSAYGDATGSDGAAGATQELHSAQAELASYQSQFTNAINAERDAMADLAETTEKAKIQEELFRELKATPADADWMGLGVSAPKDWWEQFLHEAGWDEEGRAMRKTLEYQMGQEIYQKKLFPSLGWNSVEGSWTNTGKNEMTVYEAAAAMGIDVSRDAWGGRAPLDAELFVEMGKKWEADNEERKRAEMQRSQDSASYRQYLIDSGIDPDQLPYVVPPDWTAGTQEIREGFVEGLQREDTRAEAAKIGEQLAGNMDLACAATAAELGRELLDLPLGKDIINTGQFGRALKALGAEEFSNIARLAPGDAAIIGKPTGKIEGSLGQHAVWVTKVEGTNIWATDQHKTNHVFNVGPGSPYALQYGYHLTDSMLRGAYAPPQLVAEQATSDLAAATDEATKAEQERVKAAEKLIAKYNEEEQQTARKIELLKRINNDWAAAEIKRLEEARTQDKAQTMMGLFAAGLEQYVANIDPAALADLNQALRDYANSTNDQLLKEQAEKDAREAQEQRDKLVRQQIEERYRQAELRQAQLRGGGYETTAEHYERDKTGKQKLIPKRTDYTGYIPDALRVEQNLSQLEALRDALAVPGISPELKARLEGAAQDISFELNKLAAELKTQNPTLSAWASDVAGFGNSVYTASTSLQALSAAAAAAAGAVERIASAVAASVQAAAQGIAEQLAAAGRQSTDAPAEPGAGGAVGWTGKVSPDTTYLINDPATGRDMYVSNALAQRLLDAGGSIRQTFPSQAGTADAANPLTGITPPSHIEEACPGGT